MYFLVALRSQEEKFWSIFKLPYDSSLKLFVLVFSYTFRNLDNVLYLEETLWGIYYIV